MRILIYSRAFAPSVGGIETVVMSLAGGLAQLNGAKADTRVTIATATAAGEFDDASLPYTVVRRPKLLRLISLIRSADVVHLAGPCLLPMTLALALRKPVVVEHHGFQSICPNGQLLHEPSQSPCPGHFQARRHAQCLRCNAGSGKLRSVRSWLLTFPRRWMCKKVDRNFMPTDWLSGLLDLPRATTVHHGLHLNADAIALAEPAANSTFAYLGRLVTTKGVRTLLEATRKLVGEGHRLRVIVIGDGPERHRLEDYVAQSGLQESVEFTGYLPANCVEACLAKVATVVMPSLAGEVFGMVAAENMLRGKLVIASDIGAVREVIGDTGLCFPAGDYVALSQLMKQVLQDAGLPNRFGMAARHRVENCFAAVSMVQCHAQIYRTVVKAS